VLSFFVFLGKVRVGVGVGRKGRKVCWKGGRLMVEIAYQAGIFLLRGGRAGERTMGGGEGVLNRSLSISIPPFGILFKPGEK